MISISLSPNTQHDDVITALKVLFSPWVWRKGNGSEEVENWFKNYLQTENIALTNSGRSALFTILNTFGIKAGDEVIIQSFTCLAVPEVIKWVGAKPVYVDINENLNINEKDLIMKITPRTRAIIVQHTFGLPAQIDKILDLAKKNNILVIEDCAHSLGAIYKGKRIGTFGDASFFSFGRDKIISCVFGGAAAINTKDMSVLTNFQLQKSTLKNPPTKWILQQIIHPIAFSIILPTYSFGFGKFLLVMLQRLSMLTFPILPEERKGTKPKVFPRALPNALALMAFQQIKKLKKLNEHRAKLAKYYCTMLTPVPSIKILNFVQGAVYLRFNVLTSDRDKILKEAKGQSILLGNWYHDVIDPEGTGSLVEYKTGMCPNAEKIAKKSLNLPTNIRTTLKDAERIIDIFR